MECSDKAINAWLADILGEAVVFSSEIRFQITQSASATFD